MGTRDRVIVLWSRTRSGRASWATDAAIVVGLLLGSTLVVALLEGPLGFPDASSAYLPAIVVVAAMLGTVPAVAASVAAFVLYDFFFVAPTLTLVIAAPTEWLSLLLFLLVAIVVGRLAALLAAREREASQRAREARVLFSISLDLATAPTVTSAIGLVVERLRAETRMSRVWCGLGPTVLDERVVADTAGGARRPPSSPRFVLHRDAQGVPSGWVRVREPALAGTRPAEVEAVFRVPLASSGTTFGSIWASRPRKLEPPTDETTRFLVAAADQIAGAVERDRLATDATAAEIARESDALKSALLDSVSHDLRTPLSSIRVAAGHLADPAVEASPDAMRASARTVEAEAARLDRLVANLLDISRIEGGALHPVVEPYDLLDLVEQVVDRLAPTLARDAVRVDVPADVQPVLVDPIFVDQILTNLLENAVAHAGAARSIRIGAAPMPGGDRVELVVEDSGPGVPSRELAHLFEKFYRVSTPGRTARGMGIGLAVVRGLAAAMGGRVEARRSSLGGLAIAVVLPVADEPARDELTHDEPARDEPVTPGPVEAGAATAGPAVLVAPPLTGPAAGAVAPPADR
jgi:two-component system sensor histidine kinase KdpD